MVKIVGEKYVVCIEVLVLKVYKVGVVYVVEWGIIIVDIKFEFGLDEEIDEIVFIDEVFIFDSLCFWFVDEYEVGWD